MIDGSINSMEAQPVYFVDPADDNINQILLQKIKHGSLLMLNGLILPSSRLYLTKTKMPSDFDKLYNTTNEIFHNIKNTSDGSNGSTIFSIVAIGYLFAKGKDITIDKEIVEVKVLGSDMNRTALDHLRSRFMRSLDFVPLNMNAEEDQANFLVTEGMLKMDKMNDSRFKMSSVYIDGIIRQYVIPPRKHI
ncbi:5132_t:CDS:2 [Diversispora eburnea]|uniref:5132_t:CDS:1 n=1 Tax=Diversispora eburnea TaxID=1213867 RepID=A0A9N9C4Z9_9GLOM|nr:5132_t:CDS:2 [Diversispora eburnea]